MVAGVVPTPKGPVAARIEQAFSGRERRIVMQYSAPVGVSTLALLHPTGDRIRARLDDGLVFDDG